MDLQHRHNAGFEVVSLWGLRKKVRVMRATSSDSSPSSACLYPHPGVALDPSLGQRPKPAPAPLPHNDAILPRGTLV